MRIFEDKLGTGLFFGGKDRRKAHKIPQVDLEEIPRKQKYDFWAALAKALLVFMISFGAVNGFLTAFELEYNQLLCAGSLFFFSLLLASLYETGKRWFTNLVVIGVFIIYAFVAVKWFWILNTGAYAIVNRISEVAQAYFGITDGGSYSLRINDTYLTVTSIALFVAVVLVILLVIRLQYKASLIRIFLLTFSAYIIPIYFEKTPDLLSLFLLLAGYLTIGILRIGNIRKHISGQSRQALPVGIAVAGTVILLAGLFLPQNRYRRMIPKNTNKEATDQIASDFARYGFLAFFVKHTAGGGVNHGMLMQNTMVMPDYKTDLRVRFTPYSAEPLYLKSFTGLNYEGSRWSDAALSEGQEPLLLYTQQGRKQLFEQKPEIQGRGKLELFLEDDGIKEVFFPYYTDAEMVTLDGKREEFVYYPPVRSAAVPGSEGDAPGEEYLYVPPACRSAVERICRDAGFGGNAEEIAGQVAQFFDEYYTYTLRPGYYFGTRDFISYFLAARKGYCVHFASAGTMLLRYMGVPARYVEGYVVSYTDVILDGRIMEDASYSDYYQGFSGLGETALVEVEVADDHAHAWVEIYLDGQGWVIFDPTPAAEEEEETGSFWDEFFERMNRQEGEESSQQSELNAYLNDALKGGAYTGLAVIAAILLFLGGKAGIRKYREMRLPVPERVRLEYQKMTSRLKKKDEEFRRLTTPREELDWIDAHFGIENPEEFKQEIYRIFFADQACPEAEEILKKLICLRRKIRA